MTQWYSIDNRPRSVRVCHAILPANHQHAIANAAFQSEKLGMETWAERTRAQANYDNLQHRPDADCASGTI